MAKRCSPKVNFQVVLEVLTAEKTLGQVAKAYGIHPNTVDAWKQTFLEKGPEIFAQDGTVAQYERCIEDLERLIGRKEVDIALLIEKPFKSGTTGVRVDSRKSLI